MLTDQGFLKGLERDPLCSLIEKDIAECLCVREPVIRGEQACVEPVGEAEIKELRLKTGFLYVFLQQDRTSGISGSPVFV